MAKNSNSPPENGGDAPIRPAPANDGKLRFYAKSDLLVTVPGARVIKYVGRSTDGKGAWPATKEPHVADANSDAGRRLVKLTRRDSSLFPADEFTARACGVPFVPTTFADGEHVPAKGS